MSATFKRAKFSIIFLILLPALSLAVLYLYQDYTQTLHKAHVLIAQYPITPEMADSLYALIDPLNRLSTKIILLLLLILMLGYIRFFYILRQRDESFLDPATKVFNRRYYHEVMKTLDPSRYQILLLHIKNFDEIYSNYDEEITDIMMKSIANRILRIIRKHDIFIRIESASFIIFFKTKRNEKADILAQRVIDTIKEPIIAEGLYIYVNLCIAVNPTPQRSANLQEAIALAKNELQGIEVNSFKSSDHSDFNSSKKSRAIYELQEALKNKSVIPIYQPIYELKHMRISSYELFARIKSHETSFIPAKRFVELITEDPVGIELDNMMFRSAVALLKEHHLKVHLNLHVNTLLNTQFQDMITQEFQNNPTMVSLFSFEINGLKHHDTLEIKESAKKQMQHFRSLHLNIILDLADTDDLSFNDILFFNPDMVKLPADILNRNSQTLIGLCKEMNISVILKKIQSDDEINFAKENHIDYLQGYFLGEPDFILKENT